MTNNTKKKRGDDQHRLPSHETIQELAALLLRQEKKQKRSRGYASVKRVLAILGAGGVITLAFLVSPTAVMLAKPFVDAKRQNDRERWKEFNPSYLKRTIARLRREKLVTIAERNGEQIVELTKNGRRRILKYSLEHLTIDKPAFWDQQWRLVLYDVPHRRRKLRDVFRQALKSLGFYQLQESVWLYPYPCEEQITFLREYCGVGDDVLYAVATKLEDDTPYRTYFGLAA